MKKILIVDDETVLLKVYRLKFEHEGFQVETALDGLEAMAKVKSFSPDFILLDIMMPKLDGFEVLHRLKTDPATKAIPVVLLTNLSASEEDRERGLRLGATDYWVKDGFTPHEIVTKVKSLLSPPGARPQ